MKKIFKLFILITVLTLSFALIACEKEPPVTPPETPQLENFTGITFNDLEVDYDGQEHTIKATGAPTDATVTYTNAGPHVNANEYSITVKITKEGYNDYEKTATLKINKIPYPSNVKFNEKKFIHTGTEKEIVVTGDIPTNTQITYSNNKATNVGEYTASAVLSNPNYINKTLTGKFTIVSVTNLAKNTFDTIMTRPSPWSFMPEAFQKENIACNANPTLNFANSFVNVNQINQKFMGKQMYVLWEGVQGMETLLEKFDVVFATGETIAAAYQNFINDNIDEFAEYQGTVAGFNIKIVLDGAQSTMLVGNNTFSMELFTDSDNNVNKGRIQLANNAILNYEMSDDYLKFNTSLMIKGVMNMKQIEFEREDDVVSGYFYEYTGAKEVAKKTSAVITFNEDYAIVMSAKRESDDLIIKGYEEVYSATTGKFLAAEVLETNELKDYDTHWVNLFDVVGITNVKAIQNQETALHKNNHDVYLNSSSSIFSTKRSLMGIGSRHFDIEMKDVYYVLATQNGGETEYSVVETQLPMLFVQRDNVDDFGAEAKDKNSNIFATAPILPSTQIQTAQDNFSDIKTALDSLKELLTYDELITALGERNSFFN